MGSPRSRSRYVFLVKSCPVKSSSAMIPQKTMFLRPSKTGGGGGGWGMYMDTKCVCGGGTAVCSMWCVVCLCGCGCRWVWVWRGKKSSACLIMYLTTSRTSNSNTSSLASLCLYVARHCLSGNRCTQFNYARRAGWTMPPAKDKMEYSEAGRGSLASPPNRDGTTVVKRETLGIWVYRGGCDSLLYKICESSR